MKTTNNLQIKKLLCVSFMVAISGCSIPDRSRNLNDPTITASTTAAQVCANCHGAQGVSVSPNFPNLAAQSAPYLVKQLTAFRSHGRSDPEGYEFMWGLSSHLTDNQINNLAEYFSKLPPPPGNVDGFGTPDMLAKGKSIFEQGITAEAVPACSACHGSHAEGSDQFPRLAGQHADYLIKQLNIFQKTDGRPDGVAMKAVTHNLSSENMANVASYLETLGPVH